jgi:acetyltransferase-like isoleucine patch superfamily enzyme
MVANRFPLLNHLQLRGKGNVVKGLSGCLLLRSSILVAGRRDTIVIGEFSRLTRCQVEVYGDDNTVVIGASVFARQCSIHVEDSGNRLTIGDNSALCGRGHLALTEGRRMAIGCGALFSTDVTIRTGDSHSIVDQRSGQRINQGRDVIPGDHVWLGNQVIILKGPEINSNSIVASGSVLPGASFPTNVIIGGNPARVIRENVNWRSERF